VSEQSGASQVVTGYEEASCTLRPNLGTNTGSSWQHLREWRNVDTYSQLPQDSLRGKALPSMEIDSLRLGALNAPCGLEEGVRARRKASIKGASKDGRSEYAGSRPCCRA
jgi:hypothetical protein